MFIVADGLGGLVGGDLASRAAAESLLESLLTDDYPEILEKCDLGCDTTDELRELLARSREDLDHAGQFRLAYLAAHCAVLGEAQGTSMQGMAAAMVAAWFKDEVVWIGHVGDCRAYLLSDGDLACLTQDHSLAVAIVGQGMLPEGTRLSPQLRNRLTQVVGGEFPPNADVLEWRPLAGDRLLLCTDGVWDALDAETVRDLLGRDESAAQVSRMLVEEAIAAGSRDNATALAVFF